MIRIKRIYLPAESADGLRVLVDRLWPRGVSKDAAGVDLWLKDVAPSSELREWFDHSPGRWRSFRARYFTELDSRPEALARLRARVREGPVTLLYAARDERYNHAAALHDYLLSPAEDDGPEAA